MADDDDFAASDAGAEDASNPTGKGKRKPSGRTLPVLPDHGATLTDLRDWQTVALNPPAGYRVEEFIRAGRQRKDPCTLVLSTPDGGRVHFRFPEQRELSIPANLRAAVYSITDGLCHLPALTKTEQEDIWAALCMLATVLVEQGDSDEAREWVAGFVKATAGTGRVEGYTFDKPAGRYDALMKLRQRWDFTRRAAQAFGDPNVDQGTLTRPTLLIDSDSGARWLRVAELATYIRHVMGVSPMSQSTLDARMSEIGVTRHFFEVRHGTNHPSATLYRLDALIAPGDDE